MAGSRSKAGGKRPGPRPEVREATQWKPGQSGNPKGKPANYGEYRDACRECTWDALVTLHDLMHNSPDDGVRQRASSDLLNRGWGNSPIVGDDGKSLKIGADDALLALVKRLAGDE